MTNPVGDADIIRCFLQQAFWAWLFHSLPFSKTCNDRKQYVISFSLISRTGDIYIVTPAQTTVICPRLNQISRKPPSLFYLPSAFRVVFIEKRLPLLPYRFIALAHLHLLFQICGSHSDRYRKYKYHLSPTRTETNYLSTPTFRKTTSVLEKLPKVKDDGTFWLENDERFLDWTQTATTT